MTYIEFFDRIAAENISACLTYIPDRVIYLGDNGKKMKARIENYKRVFAARGHEIEFLYKTAPKNNLDTAVALLDNIVETYDDCVFDVTGGEEILLLALGIVYAKHPEKQIQIQRFNITNNVVYDCDKDGNVLQKETPELSVEENVCIYGGAVVYGGIDESKTYRWNLDAEFLEDIEKIWTVCKGDVRFWNTVIGVFEAVEIVGKCVGDDLLTTVADRQEVENYLMRHKLKYKISSGIVRYLLKNGLLLAFDDRTEDKITIGYKNPQVKKCLTKAGQALEMKIYILAQNLLEKDGSLVYHDAVNGAVIDWDGEMHDEEVEAEYDTENEIDVLLMHDVVPVFVSCKNGIVTADELYKLNTVAQRFGGDYAKKVLITTALPSMGESAEYLRQRAEDMQIRILEDVQSMDDKELGSKLATLWCS